MSNRQKLRSQGNGHPKRPETKYLDAVAVSSQLIKCRLCQEVLIFTKSKASLRDLLEFTLEHWEAKHRG